MLRALSNQRPARVRIVSAKKPKPAEVGAEAEVTPECAVEERKNEYHLQPGDQRQWRGLWLIPLIPSCEFSLRKSGPLEFRTSQSLRFHGDMVQPEQEVDSARHKVVPFPFTEGLAA